MQKSLLAALCVAATALSIASASVPFVTAGFPYYPQPVLFQTPDLMWTNTPLGQQFISAVPRVDFVELHFGAADGAHYQIVLHEQTIAGAVVATSEPVLREFSGPGVTRFNFSPPATVSTGATYVLEFVRQEPMTSAADSPEIYRPGADYPGGDGIWQGVPQARRDLYFRAGVFMSSLFSTNLPPMIADGLTRYFDSAVTFDNPHVTTFDGAKLKWDLLGSSLDSISLASGGIVPEIGIAPETGDIYYNGGNVSFARVLTNVTTSRSITVQFNANADANAVGAVLRSLQFTAPRRPVTLPTPSISSVIIIITPPGPVAISTLHITFTHPAGEAFDTRTFAVVRPNTPPSPHIFVAAGGFLHGEHVVITRRLQPTASVECNIWGAVDSDGDPLTFTWSLGPDSTILSTRPRFTNDYAPGLHWVHVMVSDGMAAAGDDEAFEVITPREALRRLRVDVRERLGAPERRLETPLRIAAYAIEKQEWTLASRQLQVFRNRLGRLVEDEELSALWYEAAGDIKYSVRPFPRFGGPISPGPFPDPSPFIPTR